MSVCGMADSRNWDGQGDRQSQRTRDGGMRVMPARLENVATAKCFVGAWKITNPELPVENAYVFMLEGNQLRGRGRTMMYEKPAPGTVGERKLVIDDYSPLANLIVEDATITWKFTPANSPVVHWRASLVNEDELLVEFRGKQPCSPDQPVVNKETLKRQK